jgi:hypothetical protein
MSGCVTLAAALWHGFLTRAERRSTAKKRFRPPGKSEAIFNFEREDRSAPVV